MEPCPCAMHLHSIHRCNLISPHVSQPSLNQKFMSFLTVDADAVRMNMCGHVEEIIGHQIAVEITQAILIPKLYSYKVSLESNRHFVQLAVTSSSGSRKLHYYSARDICVGAVTVSDSIVGDISLACGFSRAYISRHIEQNIVRYQQIVFYTST